MLHAVNKQSHRYLDQAKLQISGSCQGMFGDKVPPRGAQFDKRGIAFPCNA